MHDGISNLFEHGHSENHLIEKVPQKKGLTIMTFPEPPSFLGALLFGAFCEHLEVGKDVEIILTIEGSELLAIAFGQGFQG